MNILNVLMAIAIPSFVLAAALAYRRKVGVVDYTSGRLQWVTDRQATAPRLAGLLLVVAFLTGGAALVLYLLDHH